LKIIIFVIYQPIVRFEDDYVAMKTSNWWLSNRTTL